MIKLMLTTLMIFAATALGAAWTIETSCYNLWAGQHILAGQVCVEVSATDELCSTFTAVDGWKMEETHVWIGSHLADMPATKKGSPKIGLFPYGSGTMYSTSWSVCVTLESLGVSATCGVGDESMLLGAFHAALVRPDGVGGYDTETGWAEGDGFVDSDNGRGMWGTFSTINLLCDEDGPEPPSSLGKCETAFAYTPIETSTCFLNIDIDSDGVGDFSRWGWTIGPISAGTYFFEIYAGAGQCSLSKGTYVGDLTVNYDGSTVTATYAMTGGSPYVLTQTHLYTGTDILPTSNGEFTVAPGQYGNVEEFDEPKTSHTTSNSNNSGDIYVVAHAVVCGFSTS